MPYIVIIATVWLVYWRSLSYSHTVDDYNAYKTAMSFKKSMSWKLDKILYNVIALTYGAGTFTNRLCDNILRIVLTTAIACLIMWCFNNVWIALLWAIHPINNQTTLWLNGRRYQMSLVFGLLAYKLPLLGFVLYPLAVYFHPISIPFIIITAVTVTPVALLWALPAIPMCYKRLEWWVNCRWTIQNFEIYQKFNWRKPVLAIKCLSEYFRHGLFPTNFTMYHPEIWGVAELEGNKQRAYALNLQFWLCLALLSIIGYIGWYIGGSCLVGLLIATAGLLQWLGLWVNPTSLWAQRYATLASIGFVMFTVGLCSFFGEHYQTSILSCVFVWYLCVTLKDMEMYRDFFSFFWMHYIQQPHNQDAAYFGSMGMNNYADAANKSKLFNETAMYASHSMASSLLWCMRNKKQDLIHDFANQQLMGIKKPLDKKGA